MLRVVDVSKSFDGLQALKKVSVDVGTHGIMGLIGPNGAGKTTLFNVITGLYPASSGKVYFNDEDISSLPPEKICKRGITRTFQLVKTFNHITVGKNVTIAALLRYHSLKDARDKARQTLEMMGLEKSFDEQASKLTFCERKKLEVARALATEPKLLMLDEAMCGLNPTEIKDMMQTVLRINRIGIGVFLIEHIMSAIMNLSDRIIVLNHGEKLLEGTPQEICRNPEVIKAYLGEEYTIASC